MAAQLMAARRMAARLMAVRPMAARLTAIRLMAVRPAVLLAVACLLPAAASAAQDGEEAAAAEPGGGLRWEPSLGWDAGDHRLDLSLETRYRYERWDARASRSDGFHALRSRVGLGWRWRDRLGAFVEVQDTRLWSLAPVSSGLAANYRANTPGGDDSRSDSLRVRQAWVELAGLESRVRVGRQDIKLGTDLAYESASWHRLQRTRLAQRLVGTVGWTHGERSYDGVSASLGVLEGHHLRAFAARPTTGVFDVESAYERQESVVVGGARWTVRPGTWVDDVELAGFFVGYADDRDPDEVAGLEGEVEVYTAGASLLSVQPLGPGELDVILWGALQWGDFAAVRPGRGADRLDHLAAAGLAEAGYRLPALPLAPWLRVGVNVASGDADPEDSVHRTFFNVLPTNHGYYGYADQLAFQNLADLFGQIVLQPHPDAELEIMVHRFWLLAEDDARYAGTGAFNPQTFGYVAAPSNGSHDVGTELDVVFAWAVDEHVSVRAGYAFLWGGEAFDGGSGSSPRNTEWAFAQLQLRY